MIIRCQVQTIEMYCSGIDGGDAEPVQYETQFLSLEQQPRERHVTVHSPQKMQERNIWIHYLVPAES